MAPTHVVDGHLQLVALHGPAAVPVVGCKGILPAVQNIRQLLKLIEAHGAGHVPLRQHSQSRTNHIPLLTFAIFQMVHVNVKTFTDTILF